MTHDPITIAQPIFDQLEKAWNNADGAAFGEPFADQTDFVDIRGTHHHGDGAAMGHGHQAIFDTIYAGSTIRYAVQTAREITPGCLLVNATSTLDAPAGPLQGVHSSTITAVLIDTGNRWACTAFHNTMALEDSA